jgi:F-type H+-transporting ATPase subunit gamma
MASLQGIKKRLQGVRNINQMTSAMELVAATKMRRSQEVALASRAYALTAFEILANLVQYLHTQMNADFTQIRADKKYTRMDADEDTDTRGYGEHFALINPAARGIVRDNPRYSNNPRISAIVVVASDKGLAGSFNSAVFRKFESYLESSGLQASGFTTIAVGAKAIDYLRRRGFAVDAQYTRQGDSIRPAEVEPIANHLIDGYIAGRWDRVLVFSTHFMSTLRQEVIMRQLLPIDVAKIRATFEELIPETGRFSELHRQIIESRPARPIEYLIEPSPEVAINHLLPLLSKMQVYDLILEANASEHSARRMAMKNASDNAGELIGDLTREYNRSRQASITREIIEITSTAAALKR